MISKPLRKCKDCEIEAHSEEDLNLFAKSSQSKHGRHNHCKKCRSNYNKQFYRCNSEHRSKRHKKNRLNNKEKAMEVFNNKCRHCGIGYDGTNEVIFDFHHLAPETKDICPSKLLTRKWDTIMKEIKKCIMLCSNCHRLEHKRLRNV